MTAATHTRLGRLVTTRSGDMPGEVLDEAGAFDIYGAGGVMGRTNTANVAPPDVLVGRVGTVGSVQVLARPAWATDNTIIVAPTLDCESRWLGYVLISHDLRNEASLTAQPLLTATAVRDIRVSVVPIETQRRIADFLDDQVARIDNIIAARHTQIGQLEHSRIDAAWRALVGDAVEGERKPSGTAWLGAVPADWPFTTVHSAYDVVLGKMLDERKFTGAYTLPYLRNTNVQWDSITTDDLKLMDIEPKEYDRFTVRDGDLLICEGGQPGRSAIWYGSVSPIGFQKALHRARGRQGNDVRWLQAFLRVAVALSVFTIEFGQATIGHLTGEQLRSLRLPLPPVALQHVLADRLEAELSNLTDGQQLLRSSVDRSAELKRALITAAVTGEFDVSTADGSRLPI